MLALLLLALALGAYGTTEVECPPPSARSAWATMPRLRTTEERVLETPLRLLFLHHSCGGQWLAPPGIDDGENSIYRTAENGGGLRRALEGAGYEVHEASYGSAIAQRTDVFDWPPKFRDHMETILRCDRQDRLFADDRRNQIVMFKSCFPNSAFVGRGTEPGDPQGPELTVANAKAAYRALLPSLVERPEVLFVVVTAPPIACPPQPRWKILARRLLGRPDPRASGALARSFNDWLVDRERGWLGELAPPNVVVFDYFDVLTGFGESDFSRYPTGRDGSDSHPSAEGNARATERFVPFLDAAVHGWGAASRPAGAPSEASRS